MKISTIGVLTWQRKSFRFTGPMNTRQSRAAQTKLRPRSLLLLLFAGVLFHACPLQDCIQNLVYLIAGHQVLGKQD